jgi:hypothetical protein
LYDAIQRGHLDVLEHLYDTDPDLYDPWMFQHAAQYGHLHIVKYLYLRRIAGTARFALQSARENRHNDVVRFLLKYRFVWDDIAIDE